MFILKLILALAIQDLESPVLILKLMVAELQNELVLDDIEATDEQVIKLRLLAKHQRQKQKSIDSLRSNMIDRQQQRQMEIVEELGEELNVKLQSMHKQGKKMLESILDERQIVRMRQIVNWQRCREHGKTNLVVGMCSEFGSKFLKINGKDLYRLKTRFARNQADFIDQVIGYRKSIESVIPPEKLKPIWGSDHEVKLTGIESMFALNYFTENFQGGIVAETVVGSIHSDSQSAIELLHKKELSVEEQCRIETEIFNSAYKRLAQKINDREFRRLSRRFLRKCLQNFKNGKELAPDAAAYFGLTDEEVTNAHATYSAWKRSRDEQYARFQIQQLEEFKATLTLENLELLESHFGHPPKSVLSYFDKIEN